MSKTIDDCNKSETCTPHKLQMSLRRVRECRQGRLPCLPSCRKTRRRQDVSTIQTREDQVQ